MNSRGNPRLSLRLQAAADLISVGNRVADVGTDHAWLPIRLCLDGKIPSAIAMDIRKGPASAAAEHVLQAGLEKKICVRLSDGLSGLAEGEADTIVITGMGGTLITKILTDAGRKIQYSSELILGPQSEPHLVRKFLEENRFSIEQEKLILEDGKYYPILRAERSEHVSHLTPEEIAFGPCLLRERNETLRKWLIRKIDTNVQIQRKLEEVQGEAVLSRIHELRKEGQLLEAAMRYYEM